MRQYELLESILPCFPEAFINRNNELIIVPKINTWTALDGVSSKYSLCVKIVQWCCRDACKGVSNYWQRYTRRGLNSYLGKNLSESEWREIYQRLGNGVNPRLAQMFIDSDCDMGILQEVSK